MLPGQGPGLLRGASRPCARRSQRNGVLLGCLFRSLSLWVTSHRHSSPVLSSVCQWRHVAPPKGCCWHVGIGPSRPGAGSLHRQIVFEISGASAAIVVAV